MDPAGTAQSWRRQGELVFILFPVKVAPSGQRYREAYARLNTGRVVPGSALRAPGSRHVPAPRAVPLLGPSAPGCSMLQLEQRKPEGRLGNAVVREVRARKREKNSGAHSKRTSKAPPAISASAPQHGQHLPG